jgi:hypothetical protein
MIKENLIIISYDLTLDRLVFFLVDVNIFIFQLVVDPTCRFITITVTKFSSAD